MPETTRPSKRSELSPVELVAALRKIDAGWLQWEPETLWAELKRAGVQLTDILKNKIQAVKALLTTDAFYRDHVAFEKIVVALNDRIPLFDQYQHPSPAMIARAIKQAQQVVEPFGEWSDEVKRYVAVVCHDAGLYLLAFELAPFQESLDELSTAGRHLREEAARKLAEGAPIDESAAGIQLARLAAIKEYAS